MKHSVTEFPVCYVLRLKDFPVYAPHTKFCFALYIHVVEDFLKDTNCKQSIFFAPNLDLARRWATHKKLKIAMKPYAEVAKYYYVVGSDGTVTPAEDLFNE